MRRSAIAVVLFAVLLGMFTPAIVVGADTEASPGETKELQHLLKVIEEQQRRLDAQDSQLKEQRKALQELRNEVEALQEKSGTPAEAPPKAVAGKTSAPPPAAPQSIPKAASGSEEWSGSFGVQGLNTRFKVSGFTEMDVIHDSDAILTPSAFVTKAIVTRDATKAEGADGQTNFSVQASRVALESRTPLTDHRVTTFVSVDFFNDFGSTTPELRLRQAYGEVSNIMLGGDLLLGQAWSTFTNLYSIPNVLDFQTPNAVFGTRHPMARWSIPFKSSWTLKLAAEAPDLRIFEGADSTSKWPDGVLALGWEQGPFNLQGSFLARDLRASSNNGPVVSAFGWGLSLGGRIHMPGTLKQDFWTFGLTYGEGIGGVFNDTPPDAVYEPINNTLEPIPTLGWYAGYQHWWNPNFYSVVSYGWLKQDNEDVQAPAAYKKTQYSSANLVWTPDPRWLFGVEALYGTREDKDGESGSVLRTQFTSRFSF